MTVVMQSAVNEIWRKLPERGADGRVSISYTDLNTAINDVCGIGMDVSELDEVPQSLPASDPDNAETNPFGEEVDNFTADEAARQREVEDANDLADDYAP